MRNVSSVNTSSVSDDSERLLILTNQKLIKQGFQRNTSIVNADSSKNPKGPMSLETPKILRNFSDPKSPFTCI